MSDRASFAFCVVVVVGGGGGVGEKEWGKVGGEKSPCAEGNVESGVSFCGYKSEFHEFEKSPIFGGAGDDWGGGKRGGEGELIPFDFTFST